MKKAFTLIELLVVVLIIGILASIALPQYQLAVARARYMQLITLGNALHQGQVLYKLANGAPASDIRELDIDLPAGTSFNSSGSTLYYSWGFCAIGSTGYATCASTRDGVKYTDLGSIRECRVAQGSTEEFGKKICKSFDTTGGKVDANGYLVYTFK